MGSAPSSSSDTPGPKTLSPTTISSSDHKSGRQSQLPAAAAAAPSSSTNPSAAAAAEEGRGDSGGGGDKEEAEENEEEEGECGFCLFMKGGGCKDSFIAWEKCVEDAERFGEDVVEKCSEVTALLKKCMDAHADYYEPILKAEQAMADSIAADGDSDSATSASPATTSPAPDETVLEEEEKGSS